MFLQPRNALSSNGFRPIPEIRGFSTETFVIKFSYLIHRPIATRYRAGAVRRFTAVLN
jgi:hypothetical protein